MNSTAGGADAACCFVPHPMNRVAPAQRPTANRNTFAFMTHTPQSCSALLKHSSYGLGHTKSATARAWAHIGLGALTEWGWCSRIPDGGTVKSSRCSTKKPCRTFGRSVFWVSTEGIDRHWEMRFEALFVRQRCRQRIDDCTLPVLTVCPVPWGSLAFKTIRGRPLSVSKRSPHPSSGRPLIALKEA